MRLTVKDNSGAVIFDAAGQAVQQLLEAGHPLLVTADDTGYAQWVREQANRGHRPLNRQEAQTIDTFRQVVGS